MSRRPAAPAVDLASPEASIGRQLHDIVVPQLFALSTGLSALDRTEDPVAAKALIRDLTSTATQTLTDLRTISRGGRISSGGQLRHIVPRLRIATRTVAQLSGCAVDFTLDGDGDIPAPLDDDLTAVVWETLANAIRHGGAQRVDVAVRVLDGLLRVVVFDDGCWIEPADDASTGLAGLAQRAERRGGRLEVADTGQGTRVLWEVPLVTSCARPTPQ